jgi:hypothetical protein
MDELGLIVQELARVPLRGKTTPKPHGDEVVVFTEYFEVGLRLPSIKFLVRVLDLFNVDLHQMSSNAFIRLETFVWACHSDSYTIIMLGFASSHVCAKQPKLVQEDGVEKELQLESWYFDNRRRNEQLVPWSCRTGPRRGPWCCEELDDSSKVWPECGRELRCGRGFFIFKN